GKVDALNTVSRHGACNSWRDLQQSQLACLGPSDLKKPCAVQIEHPGDGPRHGKGFRERNRFRMYGNTVAHALADSRTCKQHARLAIRKAVHRVLFTREVLANNRIRNRSKSAQQLLSI